MLKSHPKYHNSNSTILTMLVDVSGGTVDKNQPANTRDTGSIPDPGRFHMRGATKPTHHSYWALVSRACALQQQKPAQWEAHTPQWRAALLITIRESLHKAKPSVPQINMKQKSKTLLVRCFDTDYISRNHWLSGLKGIQLEVLKFSILVSQLQKSLPHFWPVLEHIQRWGL